VTSFGTGSQAGGEWWYYSFIDENNKLNKTESEHLKNYNKYYQSLLLILFFLLIAYSLQLNATIRFVSKTGNSTPPYLTWETAADSIQKCINISVFGDSIYVANGVYQEQVVMIPGLSLIGSGTDSCWIDSRQLITMQNYKTIDMKDNCLVKGFYIRSSYNFDYGYGISAVGQTGLITQNKFSEANIGIELRNSNNKVYKNYFFNIRGGVFMWSSNSVVRKNEIYVLTDQIGVGIFIAALNNNYTPLVDSNNIMTIHHGIETSLGASPIIKNNFISATTGITSGIGGNLKIFNNKIYAEIGYEGIYGNGSYRKIINNHVAGNFLSYGISHVGPGDTVKNSVVTNSAGGISVWNNQNVTIQYNNTWENEINYYGFTADTTNLSVDPMIVNDDTTQGDLDFHLQKYSPLIDAGDPNILDKDGTRSDIGLYGGPYGESYVYQDLAPKPPKNFSAVVDSSLITLTWKRNTEADFSHYRIYRDTTNNFQIDSTNLVASVTDTFYYHLIPPGVERLYFKLTGVDNQGNESNPSEEVAVILLSVRNEWKPVNNYILYQNFPNPFNPTTKIGYKLKERGYVKLYFYDVKGELIEVLVNQYQEAGYYEVEFNGDGKTELIKVKNPFVSGVYLCQIIVQNEKGIPVFSDIIKMILLK